jgi:hypothetical protein
LIGFIRGVKGFKAFQSREIQIQLQDMGARVSGDHWELPVDAIPVPDNTDVEIDFHDKEKEDDSIY